MSAPIDPLVALARYPLVPMMVVLAAGACGAEPDLDPRLDRVEPAVVSQQTGAAAVVFGRDLYATIAVTLDDDDPPMVDAGWSVAINGDDVSGVAYRGPEAIAFVIPPGLSPSARDPYDVRAVSPDGLALDLADAFRVVECLTSECGDGYCCGTLGENACTCPGDCGDVTCGDGVCCAGQEDSTSCMEDCTDHCGDGRCDVVESPQTCPADCPSLCGDGMCGAMETPRTCPNDCGACDATCDTCGSGCCEDACTGPGQCGLNCTETDCACLFTCPAEAIRCGVGCAQAACGIECVGAHNCDVNCDGASWCELDCTDADRCSPKCRGADVCQVDCTGADSCDVKCEDAAFCQVSCSGGSCNLDCTGATTCEIMDCDGPVQSCPGDVSVCNGVCP